MCGIAGVFYQSGRVNIPAGAEKHVLETLSQRGPDGRGSFVKPGIALFHTRLSIIDLSPQSAQPLATEDNRFVIVFNGEVFNYRELRDEMINAGETFISQGDAEVVLKWYLRKGVDGLERLNGFFAFAVYDSEKHELFMARDRMGEKPLYYACDEQNGVHYFGSSLRSVYEMGMPWQLDEKVLPLFFHFNYLPAPYTPVRNVVKLMPGTAIHVTALSARKYTFYKLSLPEVSERTSAEQLAEILQSATQRRMVSDVPVGAFLSGGIDSAIVTKLAAEINPDIETFSAAFPGFDIFDESVFASETARFIGVKNHRVELTENTLKESFHSLLMHADEPYADSSAIALHALCAKVKGKYKVMLSGDGADELFGGYNKHRAEFYLQSGKFRGARKISAALLSKMKKGRHSKIGNLGRQAHKMISGEKLPAVERYWQWAGHGVPDADKCLLQTDVKQLEEIKSVLLEDVYTNPDMNHVLLNDVRLVLTNDMLYKTDYAGMQHAVEIRSPFLDPAVVSLALSTDAAQKIDSRSGKNILREAFRNRLPGDVFTRKKHGFEVPLRAWLTGEMVNDTQKWLNDEALREENILDPRVVGRIREKLFSSNPGDAHASVWAIMIFRSFYNSYKWQKA